MRRTLAQLAKASLQLLLLRKKLGHNKTGRKQNGDLVISPILIVAFSSQYASARGTRRICSQHR